MINSDSRALIWLFTITFCLFFLLYEPKKDIDYKSMEHSKDIFNDAYKLNGLRIYEFTPKNHQWHACIIVHAGGGEANFDPTITMSCIKK